MMKTKAFPVSARRGNIQRRSAAAVTRHRAAFSDPRWPHIASTLVMLREQGRHAVRIVDVDCGAGTILIEAVEYASLLGFTAIEGRGIDGSPAMIGRALSASRRIDDPAIGLDFELRDALVALREEADFPADIVIWRHADSDRHAALMADAVAMAGKVVIGDHLNRRAA